jgi:Flp pilus assembly pilin Flp
MLDLDASSRNLWRDNSAVTTIEYALLAAFVAAALAAVFGSPGSGVLDELASPILAAVDQAANLGTGD